MTAYCIKATPHGLAAMFQLGKCYRQGIRVEKNEKLAFYYYKLASNQGNVDSTFLVGLCYYYGVGVDKNESEAYRFVDLAAIRRNAFAGYYAGCHDKEIGHISSAKFNFEVVAKQGHA